MRRTEGATTIARQLSTINSTLLHLSNSMPTLPTARK